MDYVDWSIIKKDKVYKNKQIEKNEVLDPCLELCKEYLQKGLIVKYRRINETGQDGEPDIEIWVNVGNILSLLMIECKKPGGTQQPNQKEYERKYDGFSNVKYLIVKNPQELKAIIH